VVDRSGDEEPCLVLSERGQGLRGAEDLAVFSGDAGPAASGLNLEKPAEAGPYRFLDSRAWCQSRERESRIQHVRGIVRQEPPTAIRSRRTDERRDEGGDVLLF